MFEDRLHGLVKRHATEASIVRCKNNQLQHQLSGHASAGNTKLSLAVLLVATYLRKYITLRTARYVVTTRDLRSEAHHHNRPMSRVMKCRKTALYRARKARCFAEVSRCEC